MRISDWSSDVCSSDLIQPRRQDGDIVLAEGRWIGRVRVLAAGEFDGIAHHLDELALWGLHLNAHAATCGARILKGLRTALYTCGREIVALEVVNILSCILLKEGRFQQLQQIPAIRS